MVVFVVDDKRSSRMASREYTKLYLQSQKNLNNYVDLGACVRPKFSMKKLKVLKFYMLNSELKAAAYTLN